MFRSKTKKQARCACEKIVTAETGRLTALLAPRKIDRRNGKVHFVNYFCRAVPLRAEGASFVRNANPIQNKVLRRVRFTVSRTTKKNHQVFRLGDSWCEKRESNPYGITTRPSNVRVYQFRHSRIYKFLRTLPTYYTKTFLVCQYLFIIFSKNFGQKKGMPRLHPFFNRYINDYFLLFLFRH